MLKESQMENQWGGAKKPLQKIGLNIAKIGTSQEQVSFGTEATLDLDLSTSVGLPMDSLERSPGYCLSGWLECSNFLIDQFICPPK